MKKIFYSVALLICSLSSYLYASSTKIQQIQGASITFNCIPALDSIISAVPSTISFFTMDLTNACDTLSAAAQAYEDAAGAATDFQVQGDYYYNAAQAYLQACNLVLNTTINIGTIGDAQDITYIQSYRCSALETFNESFESYLQLCSTTNSASVAANAVLALADFLVNLIALNKQQETLLDNLKQISPAFTAFLKPAQSSSSCNNSCWYPIQLPGEDTANCDWKILKIPNNPTQYSGLASTYSYSDSKTRSSLGFPASNPDVPSAIMKIMGSPGQSILNESPTAPGSHNQGWLSSPTTQGTYVSNGTIGSASQPLYDMGFAGPSLGSVLLPYSQISDPYSINDPRNNSDENFANTVDIIPQPQYIYDTPAPTIVQNLHDSIKNYMYSADIHRMESYIYNAYTNITAKNSYHDDILPAIRRMGNARMKVVECYEGAIIKIIIGLTGKTSLGKESWSSIITDSNLQQNAFAAAQCVILILPMYNAIIQQIANYDIPLLSALSSIQKPSSTTAQTIDPAAQQSAAQAAQQAAASTIKNAQDTYQNAEKNQTQAIQNQINQANQNQQTEAQAQLAQQSSQQATASAQQAQQAATLASNEAASAIRNTKNVIGDQATVASAQTDAQQAQQSANDATTAAQQAQQAATNATNAAQQALQAVLKSDLQTATTAAQQAAAAATTAAQQATIATTAQQATQQKATLAIQTASQAQTTYQQTIQSEDQRSAAALNAAAQKAAQQEADVAAAQQKELQDQAQEKAKRDAANQAAIDAAKAIQDAKNQAAQQAADAAAAYAQKQTVANQQALKQIISQALADQSLSLINSPMGQTVIPETLNTAGSGATPIMQADALQKAAFKCITRITTMSDPATAVNNSNLIIAANQGAVALQQQAQQIFLQAAGQNKISPQYVASSWSEMIPTLTGYMQQYPAYAPIYNGFIAQYNQYSAAFNPPVATPATVVSAPAQTAAPANQPVVTPPAPVTPAIQVTAPAPIVQPAQAAPTAAKPAAPVTPVAQNQAPQPTPAPTPAAQPVVNPPAPVPPAKPAAPKTSSHAAASKPSSNQTSVENIIATLFEEYEAKI